MNSKRRLSLDSQQVQLYLTNMLINRSDKYDPLSATLSALADPTRRAILARLAQGERSVKDLAEPFAMSLPAVSKHLKVLERAHLIERSREAQWRPCRLAPEPLKDVASWVGQYRQLWAKPRCDWL